MTSVCYLLNVYCICNDAILSFLAVYLIGLAKTLSILLKKQLTFLIFSVFYILVICAFIFVILLLYLFFKLKPIKTKSSIPPDF